jgi:hypothetical protein
MFVGALSWSSSATPRGTRSLSRSLSHSARISFNEFSFFAMAAERTASRNEDRTRRYGISTSSRCSRSWVSFLPRSPSRTTYVGCRTLLADFAPAELGALALAEPKHAQLCANPARDPRDKVRVQALLAARGDVHVRLRDELAERVQRLGRVERVAQRRVEGRLRGVQAGGQSAEPVRRTQVLTRRSAPSRRRRSHGYREAAGLPLAPER